MNLIKLERGSVGNTPCPVCKNMHPPANKCSFDTLARRIALLEEANKHIPQILAANKKAVENAQEFQVLLRQADLAHTFLLEVLATHGEIGETIKNEYLQRINDWASATFSQDTSEQKPDTDKSTSNETKGNGSIAEMNLGKSSVLDF